MRRQGWLAFGAFGVALLAATGHARADPTARVAIRYRAPAACSSAPEFLARVDAKSPGIAWSATAGEDTATYDVAIDVVQPPGKGYHGAVGSKGEEELSREVSGASCREVEDALAFILAVELDPERARENNSPPPSASSAPATLPDRPPAPPPPAPRRHAAATPPPTSSTRWLGVGVDVGGRTGLGPTLAPQLEVAALAGVGRQERLGQPWTRGYLRASIGLAWGPPDLRNGASIALTLATLRVEGCFPRAEIHRTLQLYPCASFEGGVAVVRGESNEGGRSRVRPWLAPAAGGRLQWQIGPGLSFGAELAVFAPLIRDSFLFTRRERAAFDVPPWGIRLSFGTTLLFP